MMKLSMLALAICLVASSEAYAQNPQQGCELNNAEACMQFGIMQQTTDKVAAYKAFEKACSLGNGEACYRAAFVLNWNFGPNHICPSRARKFLRQGCKLNFKPACSAAINIWKWDLYTPVP